MLTQQNFNIEKVSHKYCYYQGYANTSSVRGGGINDIEITTRVTTITIKSSSSRSSATSSSVTVAVVVVLTVAVVVVVAVAVVVAVL